MVISRGCMPASRPSDIKKNLCRIVLVQLVNLLREGAPVAMSTRSGEFVTLREVVDEVEKMRQGIIS